MCLQSAKKMKTQSVSSDKPPEIWSHEPSITQSATEPLIASESSEKTPTASLPPQSQSPPKGTKLNTAMSRQSCRCRAGCGAKKSCICRQLGQPCLPSCHPAISSCSNGRVTSEVGAVVDLDGVKEVKSTATWVIIGNKLDLLPEDKEVILSGGWLNCRIMSGWQFLLKQKYPEVGGLQPTFGAFQPSEKEMVQVLNSGGSHWVAMSTVGCTPATVQWLDSFHGSPTLSQQQLVADMLQTKEDKILINTMNVQMQVGGSDCGLFALAFITAVLNGQDPTSLYFDQEKMRQHLCECLEKCTPLPFPTIKLQKRRRHVLHTNVVPVFCDCRLPDNGSRMVQCAGCLKWYHVKCAVENENELKKKDWFCTHC